MYSIIVIMTIGTVVIFDVLLLFFYSDVQNVASVVEQCSDTHGLIPAWYYGNKVCAYMHGNTIPYFVNISKP